GRANYPAIRGFSDEQARAIDLTKVNSQNAQSFGKFIETSYGQLSEQQVHSLTLAQIRMLPVRAREMLVFGQIKTMDTNTLRALANPTDLPNRLERDWAWLRSRTPREITAIPTHTRWGHYTNEFVHVMVSVEQMTPAQFMALSPEQLEYISPFRLSDDQV